MIKNKQMALYSFIAITIIIIDRITKSWALTLSDEWHINRFLSFGLTFNRGINWGLFNSSSAVAFVIINCIIAAVMLGIAIYTWHCLRFGGHLIGLVLILAGAVSNYFDRLNYGGVIDFIVLSAGNWSWPAFNIADVAIVSGVGLLTYSLFFKK